MKFALPISCWLLGLFVLSQERVQAQSYRVEIPQQEIAKNQYFVIKVVATDKNIGQIQGFPEIQGFQKNQQTSATMMNIINGKRSVRYEVSQHYLPQREGTFVVPAFRLNIDGNPLQVQSLKVKVGPPIQQQRRSFLDEFLGRTRPAAPKEEDYIDVKDNAFFSIQASKTEVYQGEGFMLTMAFYMAENNRVVKFSNDLGQQLEKIIQKIKPDNCWEETIDLKGNNTERVSLQGKPYRKITFYKAMYFPFNEEPIEIPSQGIEMIKFKVSKQRDRFGRPYGKRGEKYFYSRPVTVNIKPLPPHPLRERVAVGRFELKERSDRTFGKTGESVNYQFEINGTGNTNAIAAPEPQETHIFDIYPPNTFSTVRRSGNQLLSQKRFDYQLVLNEPGRHQLGNVFSWVYFDPDRERYDTLRSTTELAVTGESLRNAAIASNILGGFYEGLHQENNQLSSLAAQKPLLYAFNCLLILVILSTAYLIWKR